MSTANVRRRRAVPVVSGGVDIRSEQLRDCIERAGAVRLTDGDEVLGIVFAPAAFEQFRKDVEELELELRSWQSEVQRLEGRLIPHEQVVAETERLVAGED